MEVKKYSPLNSLKKLADKPMDCRWGRSTDEFQTLQSAFFN